VEELGAMVRALMNICVKADDKEKREDGGFSPTTHRQSLTTIEKITILLVFASQGLVQGFQGVSNTLNGAFTPKHTCHMGSISPYICMFVCLFVHLFVDPITCIFKYFKIQLFVHRVITIPKAYGQVNVKLCLLIYLFVYLSIYLFIYLFITIPKAYGQ
jgi:hypothetical protein